MVFSLQTFSSFSILIAGIIALARFRQFDRAFYPFIVCVWIAGLNETLSFILIETGHFSAVNNNIYVLLEALLFAFFFRNMGIFKSYEGLFRVILAVFVLVWAWENFYHGKIIYVSSWFRITYSFLIVLMSITTVNKVLISDINSPFVENKVPHLSKNPVLLICIGSVVYFTFKVLVEIFWLYGLNAGKEFRIQVYHILLYINLFANLVYALAVLWAPPKQIYMTQS